MTVPRPLVPRKLRRGDTIRVVAPSRSRAMVAEHDHSDIIDARFAAMGLRLTFSDHVDERDDLDSSPVTSRVADLHAAFADPDVAGILTVIGGFTASSVSPFRASSTAIDRAETSSIRWLRSRPRRVASVTGSVPFCSLKVA